MLVSDRLKNLFKNDGAKAPSFRPKIQIKQDNGALLLVSQDGTKYSLIGPKVRFVANELSEKEYFSLYKRLGRDPSLWPDNTSRRRK